jgi:hypothetical protein
MSLQRQIPLRDREHDIARIFEAVADLLAIQGESSFRVRAYRTTARTIETLGVGSGVLALQHTSRGDRGAQGNGTGSALGHGRYPRNDR